MYIGKRLKELRQLKGMSLSELAEKSGVQIATLSRIENLKMTGTIESHMNIARSLGVDITQLYTNIIKEEDKVDLKTTQSATDLFVHSEKSSYEILTAKVMHKRMMPILLKIEPEGRTSVEQSAMGTEKFVFVLDGKMEAHIEDKTYALSRNNSLYFDAALRHHFVNAGKSMAKAICVTTPVSL